MAKVLHKLRASDLEIGVIAPDHGPIRRQEPEQVLELYSRWAAQQPTRKAVVVFDTMWQSTARMARAIAEGLAAGGIAVKFMPLDGTDRSDVAAELLEAGALLVGSPTINNQIYPTVAGLMIYLKGLRPRNLVGAAFGSYGWNGQAVAKLDEALLEMGVELTEEGLRVCYVPDQEALAECRSFGKRAMAAYTADELLDFAIDREQEAHDFYMDLAGRTERPDSKDLLKELAREELTADRFPRQRMSRTSRSATTSLMCNPAAS
jgi:flavorubredoxin